MRLRLAAADDVFPIMQVYQRAVASIREDPLFLDHRSLQGSLLSDGFLWIVGEHEGKVVAVLSAKIDREQHLSRVHRTYVDPTFPDHVDPFPQLLAFLLDHLRANRLAELIYTTTYSLPLARQQATLDLGFQVLGIFPIVTEDGLSRLNGLTVRYFDDVLGVKAQEAFPLHRKLEPLYLVARDRLPLPELPVERRPQEAQGPWEPLPDLEVIAAPRFVGARFEALKARKALSVNYYPFEEANTLVTDPDRQIEIFANVSPEIRFASIISERLEIAVNPVDLYREVARLLRRQKIAYIEVINDASDWFAIDCLIRAGFVPCIYFPRLKDHGKERRDYVIFARSYETYEFPLRDAPPAYLDYLGAYYYLRMVCAAP